MFHYYCERVNKYLERGMPLLTPTGVAAGFFLGERISAFAPAVTFLFAFMTLTGALGMNFRDFFAVFRKPLPIFVFLFVFHLVIPLAVWAAAGAVFPNDGAVVTGFVLLFSIPTAVAGFIWTSIHGGNGPLALSLILLDTLLAPILTPLTVSVLMNARVAINGGGMFFSLVLMVVVPSVIGIGINQATKGSLPRAALPLFKPLSKLALLAVIAVNTARAASSISGFESVFFLIIAGAVFFSVGSFLLGALASRLARFSRADSVTVMYSVGLRNISASMVLALEFFEPRAALPVIAGILFQQTLASLAGVVLIQKAITNEHGSLPA